MGRRHDGEPGHPGVAEELAHQGDRTGDGRTGAAAVGLAQRERRDEPGDGAREQGDPDGGGHEGDDGGGDLHPSRIVTGQ